MTLIDGSSAVPSDAGAARLRALGAAAAAWHRIPLRPTADLPLRERHMPWIDLGRERREGVAPTTALLDAADDAMSDMDALSYEPVFVHGDLWAGNTMWIDGEIPTTSRGGTSLPHATHRRRWAGSSPRCARPGARISTDRR
ncbi:MAG TPA: phosphotransferase [Acidimicrobiales bacterium]